LLCGCEFVCWRSLPVNQAGWKSNVKAVHKGRFFAITVLNYDKVV
jgi:hypothetical protein